MLDAAIHAGLKSRVLTHGLATLAFRQSLGGCIPAPPRPVSKTPPATAMPNKFLTLSFYPPVREQAGAAARRRRNCLAVTGSEDVRSPAALSIAGAARRVRAWLADDSDRSLAQRIAGAAFLIRVASAGARSIVSQVLLARWMGSFEFGVYVYVWTWVLLIGDDGRSRPRHPARSASFRNIPSARRSTCCAASSPAAAGWRSRIATAMARARGARRHADRPWLAITTSHAALHRLRRRCRCSRSAACRTASRAPTTGSISR